jgi:hypothetical protein
MNPISNQLTTLAGALAGTSTDSQSSGGGAAQAAGSQSVAPGSDVLSLSDSSTEARRAALVREIERQNRDSTLTDFPAALAATSAAGRSMAGDPQGALAAQAGVNPASALSLIQES